MSAAGSPARSANLAPMLFTRILTALVLVALVLAALFLLPPRAWGALTLAAIVVAAFEWANLAGYRATARWLFVAGAPIIGLNLLFSPASGFADGWPDGVVLAVCGPAALFWALVMPAWLRGHWYPRAPLAMAVVGWLVLIAAWVALVQLQARSPWLALAAMAIVWVADIAAYFSGRAFGKRKLAPSISPGKTWEGTVAGLFGAVAVSLAFLLNTPVSLASQLTPLQAVVLGLLVSIAGQLGDLVESLFKRNVGAKDFGSLLPGHGGVLDRMDSVVFAVVVVYYWVWIIIR